MSSLQRSDYPLWFILRAPNQAHFRQRYSKLTRNPDTNKAQPDQRAHRVDAKMKARDASSLLLLVHYCRQDNRPLFFRRVPVTNTHAPSGTTAVARHRNFYILDLGHSIILRHVNAATPTLECNKEEFNPKSGLISAGPTKILQQKFEAKTRRNLLELTRGHDSTRRPGENFFGRGARDNRPFAAECDPSSHQTERSIIHSRSKSSTIGLTPKYSICPQQRCPGIELTTGNNINGSQQHRTVQ